MELKEAFRIYEEQFPEARSGLQRILRTLRREGVQTMEELRDCAENRPGELEKMRNIGPYSMEQIRTLLQFYAEYPGAIQDTEKRPTL